MFYRQITSTDDKVHEDFIKKCIAEGANFIYQIDHENNKVTIIDIGRYKDVK